MRDHHVWLASQEINVCGKGQGKGEQFHRYIHTYRWGGKQWNEFPLLCSHLFMEQYSSARIRGEIILQSHEPKPHESFPDLHVGQDSFMLLWATESKSFCLTLMFHANILGISFCLVLTFTTSSCHSPHFQSEF